MSRDSADRRLLVRGTEIDLKTEIVEISDIVVKAVEMASPLLEQRAHHLTVDVPRHGLRVNGDPTRLGQVISNLLTNAATYTPPGGAISVRARQEHGEVVLSVRDTGIGFDPEVLPRIFDLFVQEPHAVHRAKRGREGDAAHGELGIGLTIVRSLVERHGGSVAARSDGPGRGSELIVRLPVVADDGAAAGARRAARILIVDDNVDGAEMLAEALAGRGYDIRVAHEAPTALQVAAESLPDVAFLDIGLPVMDGYELAAHLRQIPGLAEIRLIAITGYGQESDRRKTRDAGFHRHLTKPVGLAAIEAALTADDDGT